MIVTKYICDKCAHEQDTPDQMWEVGITLDHRWRTGTSSAARSALWCRKCCESIALLKAAMAARERPPAHVPINPPSIEDLIREIAQEEILNARES